jgi:hypothetical protein
MRAAHTNNIRFRIAPHVRSSCRQDRIVILDTNAGTLFQCQGAAVKMWLGIAAGHDSKTIAADVSRDCGIPPEQAQQGLETFLNQLRLQKLIDDAPGKRPPRSWMLIARACLELIQYDIRLAVFGFRSIHSGLQRRACKAGPSADSDLAARIVDAVSTASSLYWRPVKCLQRSTATVRVLRGFGIAAHLVIGYRPNPFLGHAWVEVAGRVVNDSQAFAQRLTVLERV